MTLFEPNGRLKPKLTLYLGFAVAFWGALLITANRAWPDPTGPNDELSSLIVFPTLALTLISDGARRSRRPARDPALSEDLAERPGQTLVPYKAISICLLFGLPLIFAFQAFMIFRQARESSKYNSARLCPGAADEKYDFRNDETRKEIVLTLRGGCFDRYIDVPASWRGWTYEPVGGDPAKWWMAIWYSGWDMPRGPYLAVDKPEFNAPQLKLFRLQGHGQIRLYPKYRPAETQQ